MKLQEKLLKLMKGGGDLKQKLLENQITVTTTPTLVDVEFDGISNAATVSVEVQLHSDEEIVTLSGLGSAISKKTVPVTQAQAKAIQNAFANAFLTDYDTNKIKNKTVDEEAPF